MRRRLPRQARVVRERRAAADVDEEHARRLLGEGGGGRLAPRRRVAQPPLEAVGHRRVLLRAGADEAQRGRLHEDGALGRDAVLPAVGRPRVGRGGGIAQIGRPHRARLLLRRRDGLGEHARRRVAVGGLERGEQRRRVDADLEHRAAAARALDRQRARLARGEPRAHLVDAREQLLRVGVRDHGVGRGVDEARDGEAGDGRARGAVEQLQREGGDRRRLDALEVERGVVRETQQRLHVVGGAGQHVRAALLQRLRAEEARVERVLHVVAQVERGVGREAKLGRGGVDRLQRARRERRDRRVVEDGADGDRGDLRVEGGVVAGGGREAVVRARVEQRGGGARERERAVDHLDRLRGRHRRAGVRRRVRDGRLLHRRLRAVGEADGGACGGEGGDVGDQIARLLRLDACEGVVEVLLRDRVRGPGGRFREPADLPRAAQVGVGELLVVVVELEVTLLEHGGGGHDGEGFGRRGGGTVRERDLCFLLFGTINLGLL
ncbi:MAG: hypothetical protein CL862_00780 [Cyanobium sp. NAT70]|nr:hypothetical protein [Cyanobium sp. NAT70]